MNRNALSYLVATGLAACGGGAPGTQPLPLPPPLPYVVTASAVYDGNATAWCTVTVDIGGRVVPHWSITVGPVLRPGVGAAANLVTDTLWLTEEPGQYPAASFASTGRYVEFTASAPGSTGWPC